MRCLCCFPKIDDHQINRSVAMKRSLLAIALLSGMVAPVLASQDLAKARSCMACHAVEKKLVGPAFKDVAIRYTGQADAASTLAAKIMKGGRGVWGPVPMPANTQVNAAEASQLATWVLGLK